ncbi:MAG TPA: OmpA family protein, partial [Burkholderiales bacterium]|nr:OmpA family protein [Burkholderiales bacterium]
MNAPFENPFRARGKPRARRREAPPYRRKILFEALEPRLLLSADASPSLADALAASLDLTQDKQQESAPPLADATPVLDASALQAAPLADPTAASWIIELPGGTRALQASGDADNVWRITGADSGTLNGVAFSDVGTLLGGANNHDTFILEPGGSLSGHLDGGTGGFDTLVIDGGSFAAANFIASGPDSGAVVLDGKPIEYRGLEPIVDNSDTTDRVVTASAGNDQIHVRQEQSGDITVASDNGSFERVTFAAPSASLTIDAGDGDDIITLDLLGPSPGFSITVDGGAGTDRLVATRASAIALTDAALTSTGENVALSSIEQASLAAPSADATGFSGASAFSAAVPQWTPEGPSPIQGGQVAGMTDQHQPVAGSIQAVLTSGDGTILVGSSNGGVWRNGDRTVLFEFADATLSSTAQAILDRYLPFLQAHPDLPISVAGHTDNVGDATSNQTLSVQRAQAVADYLMAHGIPESQLSVNGYGEDQPTATNDTDAGRALNRRVEITTGLWEPLTDQFPSLSIGAMARDVSDALVLYAGTGGVSSFGSVGQATGILKSTDGGNTWKQIGRAALNGLKVTGIAANGSVILVTTDGGVYRSSDGGDSFDKLSDKPLAADSIDNDGDGRIDETRVATAAVQAGGSGYAKGDLIDVSGGTAVTHAQLRVTAVDGTGAVTGLQIAVKGEYTAEPTSPASTTAHTGGGSGLTVNLTFEQEETVLPAGAATDLAVDPGDPTRVYVAVPENADQPGFVHGVYFSSDSGVSFKLLDAGIDVTGVRIRLAVSAAPDSGSGQNPVYAGVVAVPETALSGNVLAGATTLSVYDANGFYRDDDHIHIGGDNSADGEDVKIAGVNTATNTLTLSAALKKAHSQDDTVIATGKNRLLRVYRLADANTPGSWTQLTVPGDTDAGINPGGQGETHFSILASATDPNVLYVGGDLQPDPSGFPNAAGAHGWTGRLFRGVVTSPSGTTSWAPITDSGAGGTGPHADSRNMVFAANGDVIEVDDGGIYRLHDPDDSASVPGTRVWTALHGKGLQITEVTSMAYDSVNDLVVIGEQDTGSARQSAPGSATYQRLQLADGG